MSDMASRPAKGSKSYDQYCPVARALDIVGDRWTLLILRDIALFGPRRFSDFKASLRGIPPTLLSDRLKSLAQHGLIEKSPNEDERYAFTDRGREIRPVLRALRDFGAPLMPAGWEKRVPPQVFKGR